MPKARGSPVCTHALGEARGACIFALGHGRHSSAVSVGLGAACQAAESSAGAMHEPVQRCPNCETGLFLPNSPFLEGISVQNSV